MASLEDADAAFAAGAPFLQFLEPPLLLLFLALFARSSVGRNRDSLYAQLFSGRLVGGGEESGIGRKRIRCVAKYLNVSLDRGKQQGRVGGTFCPRLRSW